jgi:hypothetical protein
MESLSIKKTGKVMIAVALVIFMLVALLGLSLFGHASATASAEGDPITTITTAFSANSATAHSDSTTTKKYYNQLASGEGAYPLAVNDTFTVVYTIAVSSAVRGMTMDFSYAGFAITAVAVGDTDVTSTKTRTVSGVRYTFNNTDYHRVVIVSGAAISTFQTISVTYKLTEAIATYSHKDIGATAVVDTDIYGSQENVTASTVGVYVRSTASITTTSAGKTYDASAATTSTTFTPAVGDTGNESRRSEIVTQWKPAAGEYGNDAPIDQGNYNVKVSTAANDYYEATSYDVDFTIAKKAITITADNKSSVYSQAKAALSYSYDPIDFYGRDSITVSYTGAGASIQSIGAGDGSNTAVGSYTITPVADGTGIGNYDITYVNGTYTVNRMWIAVPTVTIFNNDVTTETTIGVGGSEDVYYNGLVYSFDYAAASDSAYSGALNTAASKNVGTYTLTLTIGSNYRWGAEADAEDLANKVFTYVVKKIPVTVTLSHAAITYRDAVPTTGYAISATPAGGEDVSSVELDQADFSTTYAVGSPVGTYNIALSGDTKDALDTLLSNYTVTYDGANQLSVGKLTITATNDWIAYTDSASLTYDTAAHGIVAVPSYYTFSDGGSSVQICNVALSGGDNSNGTQTHVSGNNAAVTLTAVFTLKGDDAEDDYSNVIEDNYTLVSGTQTKDITILKKEINITANDKSITYGDAFANDGVTYGAFAGSETSAVLTGTLAYATDYVAEAGEDNRVVGTYYIRPSGLSNNDYAITYVDGTLTVGKKTVSITWSTPKSWVYDGSSHTITATIGDTEYDEAITVAAYGDDASGTNVGSYTRSVTSLSDNANYALPADVDEGYTITKAPITITITPAASLVYTSADKTVFTVTVSGMIGTETLTYTFDGTNLNEADGTFTLSNASETFTGMLAQDYALTLTAVANGTGLVGNYEYTLPDAAANTIAKATFTPGAISYAVDEVSWAAVTGTQGSDVITFTYTVNKGATEKQSSTSLMSYTASATGNDYVLAITFAGDRAANYNLIADQELKEVYSVTFTDTASEHTSEPMVFADVVRYAFEDESVAAISAWSLQGYSWEGWKYTPNEDEIEYDAPALSKSLTVRATWAIKTVSVTYYYKLAGAADWETYKADVVTNCYTALETVPSITWFSNVGWNDAATMDGATKTTLDYTTYAATRNFYTVYTFKMGTGDVDGNGSVTSADTTMYEKYIAGGYSMNVVEDIDAAWAIVDAGTYSEKVKTFTFEFVADTYFLEIVADVTGEGAFSTVDAGLILTAQTSNEDGVSIVTTDGVQAIVRTIETATATTFTVIPAAPDAVILDGVTLTEDTDYTYASRTVTLINDKSLASGKTIVIMVNGVKYTYTAA